MRNPELTISLVLFVGLIGLVITSAIFGKEYSFIGGIIGGTLGYILSQRR